MGTTRVSRERHMGGFRSSGPQNSLHQPLCSHVITLYIPHIPREVLNVRDKVSKLLVLKKHEKSNLGD